MPVSKKRIQNPNHSTMMMLMLMMAPSIGQGCVALWLVQSVVTLPLVESWLLPNNNANIFSSRNSGFSLPPTKTTPTTAFNPRCPTELHSSSSSGRHFNVVLSPSEPSNEDAFDNFKVGNCRVHRYARDSDSVETEYVMWYHGRNAALNDPSKRLPPLSTGRIGRAVSRNGLVWEKDLTGSVSEDIPGVALGLNRDSWWGFDTTHVGLGSVLLPLSTPAVMSADGVYLMYYMGGSGHETLMSTYLDSDTAIPDSLKEAVLQGMEMKIGVALSQDGISWGRVEGDDPSGACLVPYRAKDPNQSPALDRNNAPIAIPEELYCAWPEVTVNPTSKSEAFIMYYSTMTLDEKQKCIAYAVSEDGFRWFKRGICIAPNSLDSGAAAALDAKGCARCCVVADATYNESTQQWTEMEGSRTMYYEGVSSIDNKHRILMAESKDGMTWTKRGLALDVGVDSAWDSKGVGSPHCIR